MNQSFKEKFSALMRNRNFRIFLNSLYSIGASVVVLGALFKIQHWNGAGLMLTLGLITEAVIFFIYAFEPTDIPEDKPATVNDDTKDLNADFNTATRNYLHSIQRADVSLNKTAEAYEKTVNEVILKTVFKYKGISHSMGNIEDGANEFMKRSHQYSENIQQLNKLYTMQLKLAEKYIKDQEVCMEETQIYKDNLRELNHNLKELNRSYKGMLKAMKG